MINRTKPTCRIAAVAFHDTNQLRSSGVGFSGVLFCYAIIEANHTVEVTRSFYGMFNVPAKLMPFLLLIVLQVSAVEWTEYGLKRDLRNIFSWNLIFICSLTLNQDCHTERLLAWTFIWCNCRSVLYFRGYERLYADRRWAAMIYLWLVNYCCRNTASFWEWMVWYH